MSVPITMDESLSVNYIHLNDSNIITVRCNVKGFVNVPISIDVYKYH